MDPKAPGGKIYRLSHECMPGHEGGVSPFPPSSSSPQGPFFCDSSSHTNPAARCSCSVVCPAQVKGIAVLSEDVIVSGGDDKMVTVWHRLAGTNVSRLFSTLPPPQTFFEQEIAARILAIDARTAYVRSVHMCSVTRAYPRSHPLRLFIVSSRARSHIPLR
jgi:hypothetical protein